MPLVDRIVAPLRRPAGGTASGISGALPAIVSLALVVVIAGQLAALIWRALGAQDGDAEPSAAIPGPAEPVVDVAAIVNAHLFGVAPTSDPSMAPATSANLMLAGTLAGPEPEKGWAIIGASGAPARVYATGASISGGAKLYAVYPDRVILERGGARESLMLPKLAGGAGGGAPMARVNVPPPPTSGATLADSVRRLLAENPSAANDLLRPQPVFAGSTLRGYRVYPGRNRARFASFGLQPGDLVLAVNGAPLDDPNRGLEILRGVGQGSAVTLTIDRGGQQQQLTIDPVAAMQEQSADEPPEEVVEDSDDTMDSVE